MHSHRHTPLSLPVVMREGLSNILPSPPSSSLQRDAASNIPSKKRAQCYEFLHQKTRHGKGREICRMCANWATIV